MTDRDPVVAQVQRVLGDELADPAAAWSVALSGGLDSTVLLHALSGLRPAILRGPLRAIHVNHQLHPDAAEWAARCAAFCAAMHVPLEVFTVQIDARGGDGLEAAARRARYDAFRRSLAPRDRLLTAHHLDDQAETVLLNLLRGSGVLGLAGIPPRAPLGAGTVCRPLLEVSRAELLQYARRVGLSWVDDPANQDARLDRNYLRHVALRDIRKRWPAAAASVGRSARWCREAAALLETLAQRDSRGVVKRSHIDLLALCRLPEPRQRNVVRHACRMQLGSAPAEGMLRETLRQLFEARADRAPLARWSGGEVRRYRNRMFLLAAGWDRDIREAHAVLRPGATLDLGSTRGRLRLAPCGSGGLAPQVAEAGLQVRFRTGGERLRPAGQMHHRDLKVLLQEQGVVPWMRGHLPLLFAGPNLVAVADLWIAAEYLATPGTTGFAVRWDRHPAMR
jgi:tRNA(Ile)-lysidine synthase